MYKLNKKIANQGFTLIEILIVIGIIAILAAVVLIAINPARQFAQANNSQRIANINALLNAVGQYMADNQGALPANIIATKRNLADGAADICDDVVPEYIPALPVDPTVTTGPVEESACDDYDTEYTIALTPEGRVQVCAPEANNETALGDDAEEICVTR
jgi:prepilin-type N-terminal cleavage/methylation domain-containing protein